MESLEKRHYVTSEWEYRLPLHLQTIGVRANQEAIVRETGYPGYHWLQTLQGSGLFHVDGHSFILGENQGVLIAPNVAHSYEPQSHDWCTWDITFDGVWGGAIASTLDIPCGLPLGFGADTVLANAPQYFGDQADGQPDYSGLDGSLKTYSFLIQVKKHATLIGQSSFSTWQKRLLPLLTQMEQEYANPNLSLTWMSDLLAISPQRLNRLFRKAFGVSPYQYLVQLRIVKSKEMLFQAHNRSIREISEAVGFYDASHFIATFRKYEAMTPDEFRKRYLG